MDTPHGSSSTSNDSEEAPSHVAQHEPAPRGAGAALAGFTALLVVVLLLVGVLSRDGSGDLSPLADVQVFDVVSREHVKGSIQYPQSPPVGGAHAAVWQNCGFYRSPVPDEQAVHSLEHGAVWITYQPGIAPAEQARLRELAQSDSHILASSVEGLSAPVVAIAWGRQLDLQGAGDERLEAFVDAYRTGPQTPEPGAPCSGGAGQPTG